MPMNIKLPSSGYDSAFDDETSKRKERKDYLAELHHDTGQASSSKGETYSSQAGSLARAETKLNFCNYVQSLNAYERHKMLINQYFLTNERAFSSLVRDTSKDVTDNDVLRGNHKFLWDENEQLDDWGKRLAKKYYNKLFKEYCICDLSLYKQDKVGMRWRTENEVKSGKGQFLCGEKRCKEATNMRTWEMNFAYIEDKLKKNALVKLRLCHSCSYKLNYKNQKKQVKRMKKSGKHKKVRSNEASVTEDELDKNSETNEKSENENIWKETVAIPSDAKEDDEFEEYLEDMFL